MASILCPRTDCGIELPNPRIDFCTGCGTVCPGSVRAQLLGDYTPRLICWHCSTPEQPTIVTPKQIDDHFPLFHQGALNVPDFCPNPLCQAKNPTVVPSGYGWLGNLLLAVGYWALPLFAFLYVMTLGWPDSPNAALDRLAAAPWWHGVAAGSSPLATMTALAVAAKPDLLVFGAWALKSLGLLATVILPSWAVLAFRGQITRRTAGHFRRLKITARIIYVALALAFMLSCVLVPLAIFVPSVANTLALPGGLVSIAMIAIYLGVLLLIDCALPLLQLATYSFYGIELERGCRKLGQFRDFIVALFGCEGGELPITQILIGTGIVLLMKVYGFGHGLLVAGGLAVGVGLSWAAGSLIWWLIVGIVFLLAMPFVWGWEKFQAWRESRANPEP